MAARRGNEGLSDRLHDDAACESAGSLFLARAGHERPRRVDLRTLFEDARVEIDPRVPSACAGLSARRRRRRPRRDVVRLSLRGDAERIFATLGHEGGHVAFEDYSEIRANTSGVHFRLELQRCAEEDRSHGEGDATRAALAFCYPRAAVREVLEVDGWDLAAVVAICPTTPVAWAILRAAWVADRGVVVSPPGTRAPLVWAPEGITLPPWEAWATEARNLTRRERAPTGVELHAYADERGRDWSVSVLPPTHEDTAWRRLAALTWRP